MAAGLVALAPHVDLERLQLATAKRPTMFSQFRFKAIHSSVYESGGIAGLFRQNGDRATGFRRRSKPCPPAAVKRGMALRSDPINSPGQSADGCGDDKSGSSPQLEAAG
jgi:hypothetical protein